MSAAAARRLGLLALVASLVFGAAATAAAQPVYELEQYGQHVSNGPWWRHASTTNNTARVVTWHVSYSYRRCIDWSGAVSLVRLADTNLGRNQCRTTSGSLTQTLAPSESAAVLRRQITHFSYYRVLTYDRLSGRLLGTAYATERDTFQEFTFSGHF